MLSSLVVLNVQDWHIKYMCSLEPYLIALKGLYIQKEKINYLYPRPCRTNFGHHHLTFDPPVQSHLVGGRQQTWGGALKQLHRDWLLDAQVPVAAVDARQGLRGGRCRFQLVEEEGLGPRRQAAISHDVLIGFSQKEGGLGTTELALHGQVGGDRGGEAGLGGVRASPWSDSCCTRLAFRH